MSGQTKSTVSLFGALLQHFWFVAILLAAESESIWLARLFVPECGDVRQRFVKLIAAFSRLKKCFGTMPANRIGPDYWFGGILLAHWQRIAKDGKESVKQDEPTAVEERKNSDASPPIVAAADSAAVRASHKDALKIAHLARSFEEQILGLQRWALSRLERRRQTKTPTGRRKLPPRAELPFIDAWRALCDGVSQQMLTCAFAIALHDFPHSQVAPIRWSTDGEWLLRDVYVVDGVYVNAARCIVDCPAREQRSRQRPAPLCETLQCWRRPHCWLLLSFCDAASKDVRLVHVDICSATLGRYDDRRLGDIPLNTSVAPVIWSGAEYWRDPTPFIERREPHATHDRHVWAALAASHARLDDAAVEARRAAGQCFYAIGSRCRVRHVEQWKSEFGATIEIAPAELADLANGKARGTDEGCEKGGADAKERAVIERLRAESTYIELAHECAGITPSDKLCQMLIAALGVQHITNLFREACVKAVYNETDNVIEFDA